MPGGESVLAIKMVAGLMSVHCSAELDGAPIEPTETLKAQWSGPKGAWPQDDAWEPDEPKA